MALSKRYLNNGKMFHNVKIPIHVSHKLQQGNYSFDISQTHAHNTQYKWQTIFILMRLKLNGIFQKITISMRHLSFQLDKIYSIICDACVSKYMIIIFTFMYEPTEG